MVIIDVSYSSKRHICSHFISHHFSDLNYLRCEASLNSINSKLNVAK